MIRLGIFKEFKFRVSFGGIRGEFLPALLKVPRGLSTTATFYPKERYDGGGDDLFVSVALEHRRPKDGTTTVAPRFSRKIIDEMRSAEQRCHRGVLVVLVVVVVFRGEVGDSAR